jgi:hypothetical protein
VFNLRKYSVLPALLFVVVLHVGLVHSQQLTVRNESGKQAVLTRADVDALPHIKGASRVRAKLFASIDPRGIHVPIHVGVDVFVCAVHYCGCAES